MIKKFTMANWPMSFKVLTQIVIISVIGLAACWMGNNNLKQVQQASNEISGTYLESIMNVDALSKEFVTLQKLMLQHCLAENENKDAVEVYMDDAKESITTLSETYAKNLSAGEETDLYNQFSDELADYLENYESAISMSKSGNYEGAIKMANGDLTTMSDEMLVFLERMSVLNEAKVTTAIDEQGVLYNSSRSVTTGIFFVIFILLLLSFVICRVYVIKPLTRAKKQLAAIVTGINEGHGDLTARIDAAAEDEIGQLAKGINVFIGTLQSVMGNIVESTTKMNEVVESVVNSVGTANGSACDISSVMEELSATMEEVSATISDVSAAAENVDGEVSNIANASKGLNDYAAQMKNRAEELSKLAVENKAATTSIINEIVITLKKAIENSKSVEQVNELTNEILTVSSQTNLLALNASIEAARAGEAGKGFAVVANEIRQLADSTRATANKIQSINAMVTGVVNGLIKNSNAIVEYVDKTILPDYETFVTTGEQYSSDAMYVDDTMTTFEQQTDNLINMMNSITEAISNIAKAMEESTTSVNNAAISTGSLVQEMDSVNTEMATNQKITGSLKGEADKFKTE